MPPHASHVMRLRHTRLHRNPSLCPASVYGLMQVVEPTPVGVTPAQFSKRIQDIDTWP